MASDDNKIRVLVVDDLSQVRQGLVTALVLASKNLQPEIEIIGEARNGIDALDQSRACQPDVVLMDLEMPLMDGYTATRLIKSDDPSIFVIVLTIHGDPASRQRAFQAGSDAFIEKGAPLSELINAILASQRISR